LEFIAHLFHLHRIFIFFAETILKPDP